MLIEERHRKILEILNNSGSISAAQIQRLFGIGYSSATRDLRILSEKGLVQLTRGGALPVKQVASGKPAGVTCREIDEIKPNYLAVAKRAVSMIKENDVIFIISATVGYLMTTLLPDGIKLRVVTNSIAIADELRSKNGITVIMLGGEMDNKGNCYDAFAVDMINRLHFDKAFITSAGISPRFGMSIQKSQAIAFWNAVMDSSREIIGLYPTEKIGVDSVVSISPAKRLDTLITDSAASPEALEAFEEAGIDVLLADTDKSADIIAELKSSQSEGVTDSTCNTPSDTENAISKPENGNP